MEYKSEERTDSRQRISQEFITTFFFFLWKEAVIAYTFLDGGCVLFFFFLLFLVNNYLLPLNRDVDSWNKYTLG